MNLDDEVICGYLVTSRQKHINAVFLDMLQEFSRLCKAADITWFLIFGGLIGAVRHKGFVPWDDDIDIAVPRKDFDRLMTMTNEQFGAKYPYFLKNPINDPAHGELLLRFKRSDTTCIRRRDYEVLMSTKDGRPPYNMGLCLAIFPVDNYPKSKLVQKLQFSLAEVLFCFIARAYAPPKEKPFRYCISHTVFKLLGPRRFFSLRYWPYRWCRKNRSGKVQIFAHHYAPDNTIFDASVFDHAVMLPFENIEVPVPVGYTSFLETRYGDFMTFPPLETLGKPHPAYESYDTPYTVVAEKLYSGELQFPDA